MKPKRLAHSLITGLHLILALSLTLPACAGQSAPADHGVILLYHHVAEDTPPITSISPEDFESQLQYLDNNDFQVWDLPRLIEALDQGDDVPDKVVVITFDDNYRSVYTQAFPRLKKRDWPFTVFLSSDAVDKGINMQANWDQVREMAEYGATIANHSASHAHLLQRLPGESKSEWQQRITEDIKRGQRRITEETGQNHPLFAYPYGEVNRELADMVEDLGYVGIGQHSGPVGRNYPGLSLPRFPFAGKYTDMDDFALKVLTLPLPVAEVEAPGLPLPFDRAQPALTVKLAPGGYRAKSLQCFGTGQGAINLSWQNGHTVEVTANGDMPVGRSRYNCTLPTGQKLHGTQRFYWYSHPWLRFTRDEKLPD